MLPCLIFIQENMKKFLLAALILVIVTKSEAGFRCTIGGDRGCSAGCVILGQTSGTCDDNGECWCSEKSIDFKALLPSRCHLGRSICEGTKRKVNPNFKCCLLIDL